MADLTAAVKELTDAEAALEARVAAHEQKDTETIAALQATIAALQSGGTDPAVVAQAVTDISAVTAKIAAFDPDTTPPATG